MSRSGRLILGAVIAAGAVLGATQITSGSTNSTKETVFVGLVPTRLLDTRENATTFDGFDQAVGRLDADTTYELDIASRAGIPIDAASVTANFVAANPSGPGYLTVYPCSVDRPLAAAVNYRPGEDIGNEFTVPLGPDGDICLYTFAETDLVVDVSGYYIASSGGTGEQGPKGDPGEDAYSPARVIWVADDGTGDYTLLSDALDSIDDNTATKPYVIKIAPGTYTENSNVAMKNYVDVEGSGQDITTIKGSCVVPAGGGDLERSTISFGEVNSQVRQLTIEAISENNCVGVHSDQSGGEYSPSMEFVTVLSKSTGSSNSSYAIFNEESKLVVANSELTADGLTSAAMYNEDSDVQLLNSTATASNNTNSYGIEHFGASTTVIRNSTIGGGSLSLFQGNNAAAIFYVANTQLVTAQQSSSSAKMCFAGVFDSDFENVDGDSCP